MGGGPGPSQQMPMLAESGSVSALRWQEKGVADRKTFSKVVRSRMLRVKE